MYSEDSLKSLMYLGFWWRTYRELTSSPCMYCHQLKQAVPPTVIGGVLISQAALFWLWSLFRMYMYVPAKYSHRFINTNSLKRGEICILCSIIVAWFVLIRMVKRCPCRVVVGSRSSIITPLQSGAVCPHVAVCPFEIASPRQLVN